VIFVVPPLCINESQIDDGLSIVEDALVGIDKMI
jgi:4-aminobutyrate aminotransferase-like enzyme